MTLKFKCPQDCPAQSPDLNPTLLGWTEAETVSQVFISNISVWPHRRTSGRMVKNSHKLSWKCLGQHHMKPCHSSSHACDGREVNTFGYIVYVDLTTVLLILMGNKGTAQRTNSINSLRSLCVRAGSGPALSVGFDLLLYFEDNVEFVIINWPWILV